MKHWLIVGASRGLGLALTRTLCAAGERVTAVTQRDQPQQRPLEAEFSGRLRYLHADVRSETELRAAADALDSATRIDVLVYNAAIHLEHDRRDIEESAPDDMLQTLDVNAVGAARAVKHFRRFVVDGGLLLFISSEAGSIGGASRPSEYGYCMSKAALNMLAKLLANRERKLGSGVQAVAVHPGWMRTDMGGPHAHISAEEAAEGILKTLASRSATDAPLFFDYTGRPLPW